MLDGMFSALRRRGRSWVVKSLAAPNGLRGRVATSMLAALLRRNGFEADLLLARASGTNLRRALTDYIREGEPTKPHQLFDPLWYHARHPDTTVMPALVHFLFFGFLEGRSPHPAVDVELCRRNFPNALAFLSVGNHQLAQVNPFLQGCSDDLVRTGAVDDFLTEYFDADWLRKKHFDWFQAWERSVNAHDAVIAAHPLSAWLIELRKRDLPPSPYVFRATGPGPVASGLGNALEAERPGSRLVRLGLSGYADASHAKYTGVRIPTADRLVLLRTSDRDRCLLGHHDELFQTLADPTIGIKSLNYIASGERHILLAPKPELAIDGRLVHLMHEYSSNYFHAMVEVVTRFIRLRNDAPSALVRAALLVDDAILPVPRRLLEGLAGRRPRIHLVPSGRIVSASTLIYPRETAFEPDVYIREPRIGEQTVDQEALKFLVRETLSLYPGAERRAETGSRVLILRQGTRRALHGQDRLWHALRERGFEAYTPTASTPLEEQIQVFRTADVVVAPTGAALTNILFMRPGSRVVCLSSRQASLALGIWDQLANVASIELRHVRSSVRYATNRVAEMYNHHDYELDLEKVFEAL